jgi:hypothetical protein
VEEQKEQYTMTTTGASKILGITVQGVIMAIKRGQLDARRYGTGKRAVWMINPDSARTYRDRVKGPGRPKKDSAETL